MSDGQISEEALALFKSEEALATAVARQMLQLLGGSVQLEDLEAFARRGLLEAAMRYDPARGVPFRAFANYRVKGAVVDSLRELSGLPRRVYLSLRTFDVGVQVSAGRAEDALGNRLPSGLTPEAAAEALSEHLASMATAMAVGLLGEPVFDEEGEITLVSQDDDPEAALGRARLLNAVEETLTGLPELEATLVRRHFLEGERIDLVAAELGLSKSWGSRLLARATERLSKRLREHR